MARQARQTEWLDSPALKRGIAVGTLLQVVLVILVHFNAWIALHASLFAGMMISATAGYLYAQDVGKGYGLGAYGGTIVGGVCGSIGFLASAILGDMAPGELALRTAVSILTGAVGGVFGQMAADWN